MFCSRQTLITGGTFNNTQHVQFGLPKGGFERLQEAVAPGAFHNSGERFDPPKCHPNTRLAVLKRMMDWILRADPRTREALMMWLYGPAGAGKSAIAQTLAERCHSENKLLASFFFSRNDPLRGTAQALVATLAYQLALNLPWQVRDHIVFALDHDPFILTRSLETQFSSLIVEPVKQLAEYGFFANPAAPRLIIIDGLDECANIQAQCNIIRIISQSLHCQSLPIIFLIASRPETNISSSFDLQCLGSCLTRLALDDSYLPEDDIRLFLNDKFEEIKHRHRLKKYIPAAWPTANVVENLVCKSSGQFIYASTVAKFIGCHRHRPKDRLDIVLGIRPASGETPFAELDALYTYILSGVEDVARFQQIIGFLILRRPVDVFWVNLEDFLFLEPGDLSLTLSDLGSLISLDEHGGYFGPRILHASLKDFFLYASRSKEWYIDLAERHTQYTLLCFRHVRRYSYLHHHILDRLFYHCSRARVTPELQQNILQMSVDSLIAFIRRNEKWWSPGQRIAASIGNFFSFLRSWVPDTDQRFYKAQLNSLDQFFIRHFEIYYSDPFLLLAVAASQNANSQSLMGSFRFPKASETIDTDRLFLSTTIFHYWADNYRDTLHKYRELLSQFLDDPLRSGKFFLDGANYARAAICALTYLCNHWSHRLPAVPPDPDRSIRKYTPRRWREKWGRHSVLATARMKHKFLSHRSVPYQVYNHPAPYGHYRRNDGRIFFNVSKNPWMQESRARGVFRLALIHLPHVLKRAEISTALFEFARQAKFGRRSETFPKSTKLAQRAITEYLARFHEAHTELRNMDVDCN